MARSTVRAPWVWAALGLAAALVGAWLVAAPRHAESTRTSEAAARSACARALVLYAQSQHAAALRELDAIPRGETLAPDLAAQVATLRADLESRVAKEDELRRSAAGKAYFASQLEGFVSQHLTTGIRAPEARVFLKRARFFRERWPEHPELPWVARQEARIAAALDLSEPPTFADVEFEVRSLTWSHPRDYAEAFAVARAFQAVAAGDDASRIAQLLSELEVQRNEWFQERLETARSHYARQDRGASLAVLCSIVRGAGDELMADDAARRMLEHGSADELAAWLRNLRESDPELFSSVEPNGVIARFLREREP